MKYWAKVEVERARAERLLAMDVSDLRGGALMEAIKQRSATRANLAPYRWGDLNEIAGPQVLGRAERACKYAHTLLRMTFGSVADRLVVVIQQ